MDQLGRPRSDIRAYTLPGFATSDRTKSNAWALMKAIGVTADEIDIRPAAQQMLADLDHPFAKGQPVYDVTFENVQAGLRTDYLFRLANHHKGMVVGTGDLSELALGWCTYGVGDQMSHYNPNSGVPKTLIQHLIRFVAASGDVDAATSDLLEDILATEISPELVPGEEVQATESFVGPYALQDFNLYYLTRYGMAPSKIAFLAWTAWRDASTGAWPVGIPRRPGGPTTCRDQALAGAVPEPVLRQPIQALGHAQRPEDARPAAPVAARRLAHAVGCDGRRLAGRTARRNASLRFFPTEVNDVVSP